MSLFLSLVRCGLLCSRTPTLDGLASVCCFDVFMMRLFGFCWACILAMIPRFVVRDMWSSSFFVL